MQLAERYLSKVWGSGEPGGGPLTPTALARACVAVLPVDAAGISSTQHLVPIPLGASDPTAALVEQLQATLGEGPCLAAVASGRPLVADPTMLATCWSVYSAELVHQTPFRSVAAVPLTVPGQPTIGALSLYATRPDLDTVLDGQQVKWEIADLIAGVLAGQLAGSGMEGHPGLSWLETDPVRNRIMVWTAVGMVMVTADLPQADALAALRAYAYRHGLTLDDLAEQLVFECRDPRTLVE